jgi:hypothetical protein
MTIDIRKSKPLPLLILISVLTGWQNASSQRCGANSQQQSEGTVNARDALQDQPSSRTLVTIPVVVHVVWNKPEENIPDEQIHAQLEVLNRDFRAANVEIAQVPAIFEDKIADVGIEFCLASRDPTGKATNGITRTFTPNTVGIGGTPSIHFSALGGKDAWAPAHYLNIWVAKFAGGVGGIATFPGQGPADEDGVEIDYRQFGTGSNLQPPYHLGRTCTHEIGHYFNLEHIWGPSINSCCNEDDFVSDTPNSCETYLGQCPVHPVFSCLQPDMFMNFMNFTDDDCMAMFTKGQKTRMLAALDTWRSGLLNSSACLPVAVVEPRETPRLLISQRRGDPPHGVELESTRAGEWEFGVTGMDGRCWWVGRLTANSWQPLELPSLPAGIYVLTARQGRLMTSARFALP